MQKSVSNKYTSGGQTFPNNTIFDMEFEITIQKGTNNHNTINHNCFVLLLYISPITGENTFADLDILIYLKLIEQFQLIVNSLNSARLWLTN